MPMLHKGLAYQVASTPPSSLLNCLRSHQRERSIETMSGQLVLFYNNYSICSIMVRFTLAICKALPGEQIDIDEKQIDIHNGGQLTEYYLTEVNPYGTVGKKHQNCRC